MSEKFVKEVRDLEDADMNITNILAKDRHKANVKKVIDSLNDNWG